LHSEKDVLKIGSGILNPKMDSKILNLKIYLRTINPEAKLYDPKSNCLVFMVTVLIYLS